MLRTGDEAARRQFRAQTLAQLIVNQSINQSIKLINTLINSINQLIIRLKNNRPINQPSNQLNHFIKLYFHQVHTQTSNQSISQLIIRKTVHINYSPGTGAGLSWTVCSWKTRIRCYWFRLLREEAEVQELLKERNLMILQEQENTQSGECGSSVQNIHLRPS